jgi:hypothetical protein
MCCFSKPVSAVKSTRIFVRAADEGRQFIVYTMFIRAKEDLAMILPIPVKPASGEKTVNFVNLKEYPNFFDDLESGFIMPTKSDNALEAIPASASLSTLEVVQVGDFEASYVPTVKDFSRLDSRFRLPSSTWSKLPQYQSYGFAVFKLKPGAMNVHPMAFSFPRGDTSTLFFPTVHIHDGKVHARATFDHQLYCQPYGDDYPTFGGQWKESNGPASHFMQVDKSKGVIEGDQHCYKRELTGLLTNKDTLLKVSA